MIPYDVSYLRPDSLEEAVAAYRAAAEAGGRPYYLGGGTEIVTLCRDGKLAADLLIDLKRIPECRTLDSKDGRLRFGAALTLNEIVQFARIPVLSAAARAVGDHTVRNSVTLGGNVAGALPYREAVLPFLLFDGEVELAGRGGRRRAALSQLFEKRLQLEPGECAVRFSLPAAAAEAPSFYRRRERDARVDYPLVTLCMARTEGALRFAVTGAFGYPLRAPAAEEALNRAGGGPEQRAAQALAALEALPARYLKDMRASAEYRRALFSRALVEGIRTLENAGAGGTTGGKR